ncbi:MAG: S26 family signal peptidase [Fibrobacter sp.]|uniref:S26 family signal peptidase n=1 Tax=Fibrobacter sp. TaxID=35828 RepID=UPI002A909CAD|nr:S26 family signal peptidase [Fibrobacter sp.]MDY6263152.1 S26 family signal peptidase [Fibrobacter sp.]
MSRLTRKVKRLQRKNSQSHIFLLFLFLLFVGGLAFVARLYALAPVKIMDSSMTPKFKEHSIHWMCKLPQCLSRIQDQDIVWVALKSGDAMVRNVLAMPGDSIEITDKGIVRTPHRNFKWKNEDSFIQSKTIYIPKAGDTLYFDKLNDVEQDYVLSYLHTHGQKVAVKSSLWQGDREINLDRVGSTKIANRQVSLKEIDFLPWQDRYLIELQIRQSEPGNAPIKIKRELFRLKPAKLELNPPPQTLDTNEAETAAIKDSTVKDTVAKDSVVKDTASNVAENATDPKPEEFLEEPLNEIIIEEDCYYLTCSKGASCPDSRELGYFTHNDFIGLYLKWPDRVKDKVVVPAKKLLDKAMNFALSLLATEEEEDSEQNDSETKEDQ